MTRILHAAAAAVVLATLGAGAPLAAGATDDEASPPQFTAAFMDDPANFELGQAIWARQCNFCHGKRAYPGKAPKLKPKRYDPQFVYDRVTNGFRAMPAWKNQISKHERMAVTAFVLHKRFSP